MSLTTFLDEFKTMGRSSGTNRSIKGLLESAEKDLGMSLSDATFLNWQPVILNWRNQYKPNTFNLRISKVIQYYSYMLDETEESKYNTLIRKLKKVKSTKTTEINFKDLITPADTLKMINTATHERTRAVLSILWDGWFRGGELLNLKIEDCDIDHDAKEVLFNIPDEEGCKTGNRSVLCLEVYPYMMDWLKCHPDPQPSSKLFPFSPSTLKDIIKKAYKTAGITKPARGHLIRHSGITNEVSKGVMDAEQIKYRAWGNYNSTMYSTYVHLSKDMQNNLYRRSQGKDTGELEKGVSLIASCLKCGVVVAAGASYCIPCADNIELTKKLQEQAAQLNELKTDFQTAARQKAAAK